jgi:hypothetical protein
VHPAGEQSVTDPIREKFAGSVPPPAVGMSEMLVWTTLSEQSADSATVNEPLGQQVPPSAALCCTE